MSVIATLTTAGRTAVIAVEGDLDGNSDDDFLRRIEEASTLDLAELVLEMHTQQLGAGSIRAIVYARQQMADDVQLIIASPRPGVLEALIAADLDDSVIIRH